jgi:phosphoglucosamine mutase
MKKLFGTDGIRAEAGKFPLDERTVQIIGNSLARQFTEKLGRSPRFIIGRDTRESGKWIEQAFCIGANAAEADCESAEVITTPGIAFLTQKFNFDAGVVISASHNPFQDNGIKIFLSNGKKIDEQIEREIEKDIHELGVEHLTLGEPDELNVRAEYYQDSYLNHLIEEFKALDLNGYKIVMYCANGAAHRLAPKLFRHFGAEIMTLSHAPDGRNINENCGSLHLENLQAEVIKQNADFGVSFDGDADRSLFWTVCSRYHFPRQLEMAGSGNDCAYGYLWFSFLAS